MYLDKYLTVIYWNFFNKRFKQLEEFGKYTKRHPNKETIKKISLYLTRKKTTN